jgi:hypothetical protein
MSKQVPRLSAEDVSRPPAEPKPKTGRARRWAKVEYESYVCPATGFLKARLKRTRDADLDC